jgi:hypothetical protein
MSYLQLGCGEVIFRPQFFSRIWPLVVDFLAFTALDWPLKIVPAGPLQNSQAM